MTFAACTYGSICTFDNMELTLSYDNVLVPGNAVGSQLDANGVVLLPGPPGSNTSAMNLYDNPPQLQYSILPANFPDGLQDLITAFNVTPAAVPGPTIGAGASSFILAILFVGWLLRRPAIFV